MNPPHRPVLLSQALAALRIRPDGCYLDATFGRGGHSRALLEVLGPRGRLLALDKDPQAERQALDGFIDEPRFTFVHGDFRDLDAILAEQGLRDLDGILLDCGVSSPQLDQAERGFSFQRNGPLDMRMDTTRGMTAAEWLQRVDERELSHLLKEYGEERFHRRIAKAILAARPLTTTADLAAIVAAALPKHERHKHPATRTFQAIRIAVNDELNALREFLPKAVDALAPGGRLAVIAFHSLEDRIVKRFLRQQAHGRDHDWPPELPVAANAGGGARLRLIGRSQRPDEREVQFNPRARSASLRVAEKLP